MKAIATDIAHQPYCSPAGSELDWDTNARLRYILRSSSLPIFLGLINAFILARAIIGEAGHPSFLRILLLQTLIFAIVGLLFLQRQQDLLAKLFTSELESRRMAETDPLTGLANRRALSAEFARRTAAGEAMSLIYLDLDDFKAVNDRLGHEAGDALLIETAKRLTAVCGPRNFVSRHGGDEFLILTDCGDQDEIVGLARRIRDELQRPFAWSSGEVLSAKASFGAALTAPRVMDLDMLSALADNALYAAKVAGKGGCVVALQEGGGRSLQASTM